MKAPRTEKEFFSSVSPKGQITLPVEVRRELGIKPGDRVAICLDDGVVQVRRLKSLRDYYQSVPGLDPPLDWKEVERIAHEDAAEEAAREGLP